MRRRSLGGSFAAAWVQSPQGGELVRRIKKRFEEIEKGDSVNLRIRKMHPFVPTPAYATDGAAGIDLHADTTCVLQPGQIAKVPTGLCLEIPAGCEGQVRPRSGLSSHGIVAILGTIDADYRGEVSVILENRGDAPHVVHAGDRIAQLVIAPVVRVDVEVVEELSPTKRGEKGFGSTGISAQERRSGGAEGVGSGEEAIADSAASQGFVHVSRIKAEGVEP